MQNDVNLLYIQSPRLLQNHLMSDQVLVVVDGPHWIEEALDPVPEPPEHSRLLACILEVDFDGLLSIEELPQVEFELLFIDMTLNFHSKQEDHQGVVLLVELLVDLHGTVGQLSVVIGPQMEELFKERNPE